MSEFDTRLMKHVELLISRYKIMGSIKQDIIDTYMMLEECYMHGGKLLIAGNGGSAADSEHIVGELMKGFKFQRKLDEYIRNKLIKENAEMGQVLADKLQGALSAISLNSYTSFMTAYMNDCEPQLFFAQQVIGYGDKNDVLFGISTSGNSKNIIYAAVTAKAKGMKVAALTGSYESELSKIADVCIKAPGCETYAIQELHLPIYHCLCLMLEDRFFGEK